MNIHGTIITNLQGAITSATRLRGKPVYRDTLLHWQGVLEEARSARASIDETDYPSLDSLVARLMGEISGFQAGSPVQPAPAPIDGPSLEASYRGEPGVTD